MTACPQDSNHTTPAIIPPLPRHTSSQSFLSQFYSDNLCKGSATWWVFNPEMSQVREICKQKKINDIATGPTVSLTISSKDDKLYLELSGDSSQTYHDNHHYCIIMITVNGLWPVTPLDLIALTNAGIGTVTFMKVQMIFLSESNPNRILPNTQLKIDIH